MTLASMCSYFATAGIALCALTGVQAMQTARQIEEVRITGNRRIPESTISYYIHSSAGETYDKRGVFEDYWRLRNTGFFDKVTVETSEGPMGAIVSFDVTERLLIRRIEVTGLPESGRLTIGSILEWFEVAGVGLSVESPLDRSRLSVAQEALAQLVEIEGYARPSVDVEIHRQSESSVSIEFLVRFD